MGKIKLYVEISLRFVMFKNWAETPSTLVILPMDRLNRMHDTDTHSSQLVHGPECQARGVVDGAGKRLHSYWRATAATCVAGFAL